MPSQLTPGINYVYFVGVSSILLSIIASLFAYKEKSAKGAKALSARYIGGFNAFFTLIFLLGLFNPVGVNAFNIEGGPYPITQNEIFIILWIISGILLIIAGMIYEDQNLKRII